MQFRFLEKKMCAPTVAAFPVFLVTEMNRTFVNYFILNGLSGAEQGSIRSKNENPGPAALGLGRVLLLNCYIANL